MSGHALPPPGGCLHPEGDIEINAGRPVVEITVISRGDRPIQVGSHHHFAEANRALLFDRAAAYGQHLDIPAGTAVRFEPGERKRVALVPFTGARWLSGFQGLVAGGLDEPGAADRFLQALADAGFDTRAEGPA